DFSSIGSIEDMGAERRQLGGIFMLCAWVGGQIGGIVELFRVDEKRHDDPVGFFESRAHQAQMPFMQGAHSWYDANRQVFLPPASNDPAQICHRPDDGNAHVWSPRSMSFVVSPKTCSIPGNRRSLTSRA